MQFVFKAPSLEKPTYETLEEVSRKRFKKIERLLTPKDRDPVVEISVDKTGDEFKIKAELKGDEKVLVNTKNRDLRQGIVDASLELKRRIRKGKKKRIDLSRVRGAMNKVNPARLLSR